jgi:hypothetical protein
MEILFCIDFSKYLMWNEALADFQLDTINPGHGSISGKSIWTLCLTEPKTPNTSQTQSILSSFLYLLERDGTASKIYKIIVPAKSTSIVHIGVNISNLEKYFKQFGDIPYPNQLHELMITADSEQLLSYTGVDITATSVDTKHIGKLYSTFPPNVQSICHYNEENWEYRHGEANEPTRTSPNFSVIISPEYTLINDIIKTQNWIDSAKTIKLNTFGKIYYNNVLKIYIPVHMIIDSEAEQLDNVRILTPKYLLAHPVLRIHPLDLDKWYLSESRFQNLTVSLRHLLTRVEINNNIFINPRLIHWASVTIASKDITTQNNVTADWHFIVDMNSESFIKKTLNTVLWYRICYALEIKPIFFLQPLVTRASWIYQPITNYTIKLSISNYNKWENKIVSRNFNRSDPLQIHMAQFGLAATNTIDTFSSKTFWHLALKTGSQLHISNINKVFDGYKLIAANELILNNTICEICTDSKVDCLLDSCGHLFCVRCMNQLFAAEATQISPCPTCRVLFGHQEWTCISKNNRFIKNITLNKKIQFQKCVNEFNLINKSTILVVCAEDETAQIISEWVDELFVSNPISFNIISLSTWTQCNFTNIKYTHILFTWSNFRIGSTKSLNIQNKVQSIIQEFSANTCLITVLVEEGGEQEAIDWQSMTAALYPNTIQSSTYAHGSPLILSTD